MQNFAKKAKRNLDFFANFLHISFPRKVFDFYCKIHFREKKRNKKENFREISNFFRKSFCSLETLEPMHSSERGWVDSGLAYALYPFLGFPLKEIRMLKIGHVPHVIT